APATLYFDSLINDSNNLNWSLNGPGGAVVSGRSFCGSLSRAISDPQLRLPAGSYTLTVDASGDAVGAYSFRLLDLAGATTITPGTPFSGSLSPGNETDLFKLDRKSVV